MKANRKIRENFERTRISKEITKIVGYMKLQG